MQTVYAAGDGHFEENMAFFIGSRRKQFYNGATNSWLDRNYKENGARFYLEGNSKNINARLTPAGADKFLQNLHLNIDETTNQSGSYIINASTVSATISQNASANLYYANALSSTISKRNSQSRPYVVGTSSDASIYDGNQCYVLETYEVFSCSAKKIDGLIC